MYPREDAFANDYLGIFYYDFDVGHAPLQTFPSRLKVVSGRSIAFFECSVSHHHSPPFHTFGSFTVSPTPEDLSLPHLQGSQSGQGSSGKDHVGACSDMRIVRPRELNNEGRPAVKSRSSTLGLCWRPFPKYSVGCYYKVYLGGLMLEPIGGSCHSVSGIEMQSPLIP